MKFRDSVRFALLLKIAALRKENESFVLTVRVITQTIENDLIERVSPGRPVGVDLSGFCWCLPQF